MKKKNEDLPKVNRNNGRTKQVVSLHIPKMFRRKERSRKNRDAKRRGDGKILRSGNDFMSLTRFSNGGNIGATHFYPPRKKYKGWQRENRKYKKAA